MVMNVLLNISEMAYKLLAGEEAKCLRSSVSNLSHKVNDNEKAYSKNMKH